MRQCTCILCHSLGILSFASSPLLGQGGLQWAQFLRVSQTKTENPQHPQLYPSPSLGVASDYTIRGEPKQSDSHTHTHALDQIGQAFQERLFGNASQRSCHDLTQSHVTVVTIALNVFHSNTLLHGPFQFSWPPRDLGWLMSLWSLQGLTERY